MSSCSGQNDLVWKQLFPNCSPVFNKTHFLSDRSIAPCSMGFAHSGIWARSYELTIFPRRQCNSSFGCGQCPARGSLSAVLSNTLSSASPERRSIRFQRLRSYRSRIFASGMSCPPRATLQRTRSICSSTLSRPTYQMRTSIPDLVACFSSRAIVLPPRVVSNAKSCRVTIDTSSRRRPSRHAHAFASSWLIPGDSERSS